MLKKHSGACEGGSRSLEGCSLFRRCVGRVKHPLLQCSQSENGQEGVCGSDGFVFPLVVLPPPNVDVFESVKAREKQQTVRREGGSMSWAPAERADGCVTRAPLHCSSINKAVEKKTKSFSLFH